ncbi:DNA topoisomerase III [Castellaniella sp.]|uniref:DNA topoisomerase III n=1 Tax=Castellaniella sp. TaxID=1955812 RepID=UPI002AFE09B0|nr:DNA topoisomerase III [Castellaniella sp.]
MRLFLCEKPSQGKDIGRILGATQRGEGCLSGSGVTITWCIGHLVEAAAPEVYDAALKRWSLEQLPIIPQQWRVEVKPKTATQFKVVKALLAKATHLVIATDADREGELIAREIIDLCGYRGPIERLWLSALNDASIRTALGKLRPSSDTLPMYYSALARSRADWLVGMNLSRLFTLLGRQAGYDGVLSVGRVQTPTLKLVVDRDREIAAFKSAPFWAIDVSLSTEGQAFSAQWVAPDGCTDDAGRCLQQPVAQQAALQIRVADNTQVVSVETERVREGPPLLFDLSTLQEVCSKQLGLDVQETLQIAQALYETHKATTYPRSDSGYLPESMFAEVPAVLDSLLKTDPSLRPIMSQLDRSQRSRAWNDGKVTAHHGIIPTLEPANLSPLSEKELAVYRLIRAHYLAQFLPHHEFDRTVAEFSCGQQMLVATGKQVVVKGWRLVLAEPQADEDGDDAARSQVLPPLRGGLACQVAEVEIKALKTMPPKPYTQGELVKSMKGIARFVTDPRLKQKLKDTTGIGTEATRANIISVLIARGYIVKKGRSIHASDAAFTLIDAVPAAIADPGTTAVWEQALDMIEAGQLTLDVFLSKQAAWISQLIAQYGSMSLSIKLPHGPACPQCGAATRQRTGKSGPFWSCSRYPDCKGTLPVESGTPKRGASRSRSSGRKGA